MFSPFPILSHYSHKAWHTFQVSLFHHLLRYLHFRSIRESSNQVLPRIGALCQYNGVNSFGGSTIALNTQESIKTVSVCVRKALLIKLTKFFFKL